MQDRHQHAMGKRALAAWPPFSIIVNPLLFSPSLQSSVRLPKADEENVKSAGASSRVCHHQKGKGENLAER